jgi:hypothetical protein
MGNEWAAWRNVTFSSQQQIPTTGRRLFAECPGTPTRPSGRGAGTPQPAKELSRELSRPNIAKREPQDVDTRHQSRWLQIPDDFAPAQVRKNANQMMPRISTASPVEAESNASTEGPGSACRARPRFRRSGGSVWSRWQPHSKPASSSIPTVEKQRMVRNDVPSLLRR